MRATQMKHRRTKKKKYTHFVCQMGVLTMYEPSPRSASDSNRNRCHNNKAAKKRKKKEKNNM